MARRLELEVAATPAGGIGAPSGFALAHVPVSVVDGGRLDVCDARRHRVPDCGAIAEMVTIA